MLEIKHTTDLNSPIYADSLAIRKTVFVMEQGFPADLEFDSSENKAMHFVLYEDNIKKATLRLLPLPEKPKVAMVQRVCVLPEFRK